MSVEIVTPIGHTWTSRRPIDSSIETMEDIVREKSMEKKGRGEVARLKHGLDQNTLDEVLQ